MTDDVEDPGPAPIAAAAAEPGATAEKGERIAKRLARAGLCSRRDAERWIAERRVSVNGHVLDSPAVTVGETDHIVVDGKPLPEADRTRLWRYHKRAGVMTTHKDPQGRPTVFARLPDDMPRVVSVGRLDFNSEGLLLLTNDGALARRLDLPGETLTARRATLDGHTLSAEIGGERRTATVVRSGFDITVLHDGRTWRIRRDDPSARAAERDAGDGRLAAPMPGTVVQLLIGPGDAVTGGQPLIVVEAMKMEHTIKAPADGKVTAVHYAVGDPVAEGADLLEFEAAQ